MRSNSHRDHHPTTTFNTTWCLWPQPRGAPPRKPTHVGRRSCVDILYGPPTPKTGCMGQFPGGGGSRPCAITCRLRRVFSMRSSGSKTRDAHVRIPRRVVDVAEMDPPLPVVRRAVERRAASLWERRRRAALEGVKVVRRVIRADGWSAWERVDD